MTIYPIILNVECVMRELLLSIILFGCRDKSNDDLENQDIIVDLDGDRPLLAGTPRSAGCRRARKRATLTQRCWYCVGADHSGAKWSVAGSNRPFWGQNSPFANRTKYALLRTVRVTHKIIDMVL